LIQRCTKPDAKEFLDAPAAAIFVCVQWWLQLADNYSNMYIYIYDIILYIGVYISMLHSSLNTKNILIFDICIYLIIYPIVLFIAMDLS
jgi:hypothetical protein